MFDRLMKPPDGERYLWEEFEKWAVGEGINNHWDDISPHWHCWKTAIISYEDNMRRILGVPKPQTNRAEAGDSGG